MVKEAWDVRGEAGSEDEIGRTPARVERASSVGYFFRATLRAGLRVVC